MYNTSPPLIQRAVEHFQRGELAPASQLLQKILDSQPRQFDALHLLGVIRAMEGRYDEGIELMRKALGISKNNAQLQFNLARALSDSGQNEEALLHHRKATQLAPQNPEAWLNLGYALQILKDLDGALKAFETTLQLAPNFAQAWNNRGALLNLLNRSTEALESFEQALRLEPKLVEVHVNKGAALQALGLTEKAIAAYKDAIRIKPTYAEAWLNLGSVLLGQEYFEEAQAVAEESVRLAPDLAQAWINLGSALRLRGKPTEALDCYNKAQALESNLFEIHVNRGAALEDLGEMEQALSAYRQALSIDPDHLDTRWSVSRVQLKSGHYKDAWEDYEVRWKQPGGAPPIWATTKPRWRGKPGQGPILLWGEQGVGDQILYASILPDLANFPQRKLLALDHRLIPLFSRSMPSYEVLSLHSVTDALPFAEQLPLGSLPLYFRPSLPSFPKDRHHYLQADAGRSANLRKRIAKPGKRICGIAWSSTRKFFGSSKNVPLETLLTALAGLPLHFVDLQYGDTREEREAVQRNHGIEVQHVDEIDNFNDLDGLAALIEACDVVLTTSNSTAHLAGALGKETLLLLPLGKGRLWYWVEHGGSNPWYPSISQFSQTQLADWQDPLARVRYHLQQNEKT